MKAILIAGTHSGCGKTTISLGIMTALTKMGLVVQPFKTGPDFIDTGLHRIATGIASRNLDIFMCGSDYVKHSFNKLSSRADISIIEGVMGLYDGDYSTYNLAKTLKLPIILVVDATGIAESIWAIVKGFLDFDIDGLIKAVIFNKAGSQRHIERLIRAKIDVPVIGIMQRESLIEIPKRHLGLTVAEEEPLRNDALKKLSEEVVKNIDINFLLSVGDIYQHENNFNLEFNRELFNLLPDKARVLIAYDKAFCFYYEDNIEFFKDRGAEILRFSPLQDEALPETDLLYIGGGYPELYAKELSANKFIIDAIKDYAHSGGLLYAECGGFMYLSKGIFNFENDYFEMVGLFDIKTKMRQSLTRLGYRTILIEQECILSKKGFLLRGHEYHYSEIVHKGDVTNVFSVADAEGNRVDAEGYSYKNSLASYIHIHFGSCVKKTIKES